MKLSSLKLKKLLYFRKEFAKPEKQTKKIRSEQICMFTDRKDSNAF